MNANKIKPNILENSEKVNWLPVPFMVVQSTISVSESATCLMGRPLMLQIKTAQMSDWAVFCRVMSSPHISKEGFMLID